MSNNFAMVANVSTGGIITSNIEDLKLALKEKMKDYKVCVGDDALASMKSDRAELNKLIKEIESRKKAVKDEFMQPWTDFDAEMKELVGIVKETVSTLDTEVKRIEEAEREERKQKIQQFFEEYATSKNFWNDPFCKVLYDRIYDAKWENKTVTLKTWKTAIMNAIDDYLKNIEALKARPEYFDRTVEKYQAQMDIKDAWEYIANQDRIKAEEEAARIRREAELEAARIRAEAEARAKAEAELARAKEEAERKAAEEIARAKAEAEAKARAEAEAEIARIRAEEEAKAKAEAEAKITEEIAKAKSMPQPVITQDPEDFINQEVAQAVIAAKSQPAKTFINQEITDAGFFGVPTPAQNVQPSNPWTQQPVQQNPYPNPCAADSSWQPVFGDNPFAEKQMTGYTSPEYTEYQQASFNFNEPATCQMKIREQDKERVRQILTMNHIWFEM